MKYVLDTSLINKLVDGTVGADELPTDGPFVGSHIQLDELRRTTSEQRRMQLLDKFLEIIDETLSTESFALDKSRLDKARPGEGDSYLAIKRELDFLNGGKENNSEDALIADVALRNGFVLLTAGFHLYQVAYNHGVGVIYWTISRTRK